MHEQILQPSPIKLNHTPERLTLRLLTARFAHMSNARPWANDIISPYLLACYETQIGHRHCLMRVISVKFQYGILKFY